MRVALDCTALLAEPTGIGAFTRALIDGFASHNGIDPVAFALTWRGRGRLASLVPDGVDVWPRPLPARPLRSAWLRSDLPRLDHLIGAHDIAHGTNFVVPPSRAAQLVTVHDLTAVRFPELCTDDTLQFPALIRRAIDRGAWVHAVSEFVRAEIIQYFPISPERVRVVPNAVSPMPDGDAAAGRSLARAEQYVLAVGTVEPRKDLPLLVAAFDAIAADRPDLHLIHVGPNGWGAERFDEAIVASPHSARIRRLGYVSDQQRTHLLSGALVFAYPSTYEGFGIPPLEAMTAGTPVVTSDAGALLEIAGPASLQAPVGDVDAFAEALARVIDDHDLRADLIRRGPAHAARYSHTRLIDEMVALYADLLDA